MKNIKVKIRVETDYDFTLDLPKISNINKMVYKGYLYKINLNLDEKNAKENLLIFLKGIEIKSTKEWHKKNLFDGISKYETQLNKYGLSSSHMDLLGGGNWSFVVNISKEELL